MGKRFKTADASKKPNLPFVFTLIERCQRHGIDYGLMKRLNYHDLLHLVVEYDIKELEQSLNQKEKQRQQRDGKEKVPATNDDVLRMHKK